MASSAGTCEIVEVRDELDLLHKFNGGNRLQVKVRGKEVKSHGHPVADDLDLLIDASKKSVKAGTSRASGAGISESPSLKQALRRLCISQASEMAAIKRSSKLIGSSSVSDTGTIERLYMSLVVEAKEARNSRERSSKAGESRDVKSSWNSSVSSPHTAVSALRNAKMRRTQDLIAAEQVKGTGNLKAGKHVVSPQLVKPVPQNEAGSRKKGKQESVPAFVNSSRLNGFREVGTLHCKTKLTSSKTVFPTSGEKNPDGIVGSKNNNSGSSNNCNGSGNFTLKVIEGLVSRGKGECSESSQSSLGDCSCSTSISEESSYCSSRSNCNRPHMSKDVRWAAIQHVVNEQGSLGLKNFKLLRRLGCGDIGTVYLAELLGSGYLFALKVMDVDYLVRRKKMLRAQIERDILQMLDHPFLPTLYTHFTTDNLSFLVMEYCPGGDLHVLRQMQPDRSFHEPAARFYVAEILLALEYLHMLGVIYRDLKPENILVREDGHIMLSDFDLSMRCTVSPALLSSSSFGSNVTHRKVPRHCTDASCMEPFCLQSSWARGSCFTPRLLSSTSMVKTQKMKFDITQNRSLPQIVVEPTDARSNSFVGTHEYLAPEIIRGDGHGSSVDWWTLGIFLYELLFGRTPFKGSGNEDTLANVVFQTLQFPESPDVSVYAKDLIRGLLVKEPESRLGSVRGAAEIKQHPFFEGLNWALIRCAAPPEVPGIYGAASPQVAKKEEGKHLGFNQLF